MLYHRFGESGLPVWAFLVIAAALPMPVAARLGPVAAASDEPAQEADGDEDRKSVV
jgi:hypothetical protein